MDPTEAAAPSFSAHSSAESPGPSSRSLIACFLFPMVALVLTTLIAAGAARSWPPGFTATLALMLFVLHVAFVGRKANPVDPVIWVPVAMLFFYFSTPAALWLAGVTGPSAHDAWMIGAPRHLEQGYVVALLTFVAFLSGIHMGGIDFAGGRAHPPDPAEYPIAIPCIVIAFGAVGMMMLGILLVGPGVVFGSYADRWLAQRQGADVRLLEVGFMFSQGATFGLLASYVGRRSITTLLAVALLGYLMLYSLLTGDRAAMFSCGMPAAWVFSRAIRRLPWIPVLTAAVVALLLLPVVKEYRENRRLDESKRASAAELASRAFAEAGSTALVYGHTLDFIPSQKGYDYGLSVVVSVLDLIPNVGLSTGKSFLPDPMSHSPSNWLTFTLNPNKWLGGGGYGFAIGAEWYFNFGIPGVLFGMMLVGAGLVFVRNRAMRSPMWLMASASVYLMMLLMVRNASGAPLKVGLWPLIGVLIVRSGLNFLVVRRERPRPDQAVPVR